jgi:two-component system alkaline phosphatase synthesis response regulator PhoP
VSKVLIVADQTQQIRELSQGLVQRGFSCSIMPCSDAAIEQAMEKKPNLTLIAMDGSLASPGMISLLQSITGEHQLPVIALLSKVALDRLDSHLNLDDFVVEPWETIEVSARIQRVLWRTSHGSGDEIIECGDLVIDLAKCEVTIDGRRLALTFREYELLKFLASNQGRVFTREALLDRVWGYDYYGGDRTVDVHIRRLRSKIEDATHTYIETARNIGYMFRREA